jgi:hypothetical protein
LSCSGVGVTSSLEQAEIIRAKIEQNIILIVIFFIKEDFG